MSLTTPRGRGFLSLNKHGIFFRTWYDFKASSMCPECGKEESIRKRRKYNIQGIKEETPKLAKGYECLSEDFTNSTTKLKFRCDKNHEFYMSWAMFKDGYRCKTCHYLYKAGNSQKILIDEVRNIAKDKKCELLSTSYTNCYTYMKFKCSICGEIFEKNVICLKKSVVGHISCAINHRAITQAHTIEYIKTETPKLAKNYECLSDIYINTRKKLKFKCNKNHEFLMCWGAFNSGGRCPICYKNSRRRDYDLLELKQYKTKVECLTRKSYKDFYYLINPDNLPRGNQQYHIDHIYSMADGFKNGILPEVLSSPVNLGMLWWYDNNAIKDKRSDITKETLYSLYRVWNI